MSEKRFKSKIEKWLEIKQKNKPADLFFQDEGYSVEQVMGVKISEDGDLQIIYYNRDSNRYSKIDHLTLSKGIAERLAIYLKDLYLTKEPDLKSIK